MKHLLIVANPRHRSFTHKVARAYADELESLGHEVAFRDLYQMKFDPVLGADELLGAAPPVVPPAIRREQRHLAAAGALAFFYPLWWAFMPAIVKGYIDRVFSVGFAYDFEGGAMLPRLTGKKALIFTSSGADMAYLRDSGQWPAMQALERDHILGPCGIELLDHVHFPAIHPELSAHTLAAHLERTRQTAGTHWSAVPVPAG